jgi:hypothetical protein
MTNNAAWQVIGASVPGAAHQQAGIPCQDAHQVRLSPRGDLLVATADGAGSAARSHDGSRLVVEQVIAALDASISQQRPRDDGGWRQLLNGAFAAAHRALVNYAAAEAAPLEAFATTLTCAVATEGMLICGQVGDGVVVLETADGALRTTVLPQRGDYANETVFLTSPGALEQVALHSEATAARALVVMTDGLLRLAMQLPDYTPLPGFFHPLLAFVAEAEDTHQAQHDLATFLASARVSNRTDDDVTLVLARRRTQ